MPLQRGFTARMITYETDHLQSRFAIDAATGDKVWVPTTLVLFQISYVMFGSLITGNIYVTVGG